MKKQFLTVVPLAAALLILAGCTQNEKGVVKPSEAKKDPAQTLQDSWNRSSEIKSSTGTLDIDISIESETVTTDGSIAMAIATDDSEDPKADMTFSASFDAGDIGSLSLSESTLRMLDDKLYFNIGGLDVQGASSEVESLISVFEEYFNSWYMIDPKDETLQSLTESVTSTLPTEAVEPADLDFVGLQQIIFDSAIFSETSYDGEEEVDGIDCVKVSFGSLDSAGIVSMLESLVQQLQGADAQDMTDAEKAQIEEALDQVDISGTVWTGVEDGYVHKISVTIEAVTESADDDTAGNPGSATITISATLNDINQPVSIETPAGAKNFTQEMQSLIDLFSGTTPR